MKTVQIHEFDLALLVTPIFTVIQRTTAYFLGCAPLIKRRATEQHHLVLLLTALSLLFSSIGQFEASAARSEKSLHQSFSSHGWTYIDQIGGGVTTVDVSGSIAYIGQGFGLSVIDVTDPFNPQEGITVPLPWNAEDIDIIGRYTYVTAGGVEIFNTMDKKNPVWRGRYETSQTAYGIEIVGNRAYVAASAIEILDLTIPYSPRLIGRYKPSSYAYDIAVDGNLGYLLGYVLHESLDIVLLSDPAKPEKLGEVGSFYGSHTLQVVGSYAYVSATSGLYVIDISLPWEPKQVWHSGDMLDPLGDLYFTDFKTYNNRGYGAVTGSNTSSSGLYEFDLSNPASPQLIRRSDPSFISSRKLVVSERWAYLAAFKEGLQIFDVYYSSIPRVWGNITTPFSSASAVTADRQNLYLAEAGHLVTFNLSAPEKPRLRARYAVDNDGSWIQVTGGRAYLESSGRLVTIDVNDPDHPALLGIAELSSPPARLYIDQNRAYSVYCTNRDDQPPAGEMKIWDITNPASAAGLATYQALGCPSDVQVVDDLAYLTSYDNQYFYLQIVDIHNPAKVVPLGLFYGTGAGQWVPNLAHWISVADGQAFLTAWDGGLRIIDIRNPEAPSQLSLVESLPFGPRINPSSPLVKGSLVYLISDSVSQGISTVRIFDVSDPANPRLHSSVELNYFLSGVERMGNNLYLTRGGMAGDMIIFRESPLQYLPMVSR